MAALGVVDAFAPRLEAGAGPDPELLHGAVPGGLPMTLGVDQGAVAVEHDGCGGPGENAVRDHRGVPFAPLRGPRAGCGPTQGMTRRTPRCQEVAGLRWALRK